MKIRKIKSCEVNMQLILSGSIKQSSICGAQRKFWNQYNNESMNWARLTTERRLISTIGTVRSVVTHSCKVDTHTVSRALPLPAWTSKRWSGTISFVTHVPAVVVSVTNPAAQHAVSIVTAEKWGWTGARRAGVVFVTAVLTVWVTITLPSRWNTVSIRLALKLTVMVAQSWRPGGWGKKTPKTADK